MQPHLFEAYLNLIYDGCAIIGEEDLLGFRQALEVTHLSKAEGWFKLKCSF